MSSDSSVSSLVPSGLMRMQADNMRLREAAQRVVNEYLAKNSIGSRVECAVYELKAALEQRRGDGAGPSSTGGGRASSAALPCAAEQEAGKE